VTTNAFASCWLVPRLPAWRKLHPEVPLEVIGTDSVLDLQAGTVMAPSVMRLAGQRRQTASPKNS
jgi:DNA-binding transcriptional LysR family regulator